MSGWTHLNDTTPKARKEYHCYLCELPISVGQTHVARRGAYEGKVVTQRMHTDCERVTEDWGYDAWETFDASAFLEEKAMFYAAKEDKT